MVDLGTYLIKYLNIGKITLEKLFTYSYIKELYESEHACTAIEQLHVILDAKYKKANLHKVMENQC